MHKPIDLIEFETMLLGRYALGSNSQLLDRSAYLLLNRLGMEGPMSIGQLSCAFGLDTSTLSRQTSALLRAGLVERIPDPDGGIARKFRITEKGRQRFDSEHAVKIAALDRIMQEWTPAELATFAAYLRRLNSDIEQRSGHPWPRR